MLTEFGKYVRKLRIDKGIVLGEMAQALGLSSAYLSGVENGKKAITEALIEKLVAFFDLEPGQIQALRQAAANSPVSVKFDLRDMPSEERTLVSAFARQVADLSPDQKQGIFNILNSSKRG